MSKKLNEQQLQGIEKMKWWFSFKAADPIGYELIDIDGLQTTTYMKIHEILQKFPTDDSNVVFGDKEIYFLNAVRKFYLKNK